MKFIVVGVGLIGMYLALSRTGSPHAAAVLTVSAGFIAMLILSLLRDA